MRLKAFGDFTNTSYELTSRLHMHKQQLCVFLETLIRCLTLDYCLYIFSRTLCTVAIKQALKSNVGASIRKQIFNDRFNWLVLSLNLQIFRL